MIKSPDVPRLMLNGELSAGDFLFHGVAAIDFLLPLQDLARKYPYDHVPHREAVARLDPNNPQLRKDERTYWDGTLTVGDWKFLNVYPEDMNQPLEWLKEMYDHEHTTNARRGIS